MWDKIWSNICRIIVKIGFKILKNKFIKNEHRSNKTNERNKVKSISTSLCGSKFLRLMMDHVRICNAQYRANDRESVCRNGPWLWPIQYRLYLCTLSFVRTKDPTYRHVSNTSVPIVRSRQKFTRRMFLHIEIHCKEMWYNNYTLQSLSHVNAAHLYSQNAWQIRGISKYIIMNI